MSRDISCVFDLLGRDENDLTSSLAFTLAQSPSLLSLITRRILPGRDFETATIRLETRGDQGRTDLEIDAGPDLVIVEAKLGWVLPGEIQLGAYAPRVSARGGGALVSLSDASPEWAAQLLPSSVLGVPVVHLPWTAVRRDLNDARVRARGRERLWLDELSVLTRVFLESSFKMRDNVPCRIACAS